MLNHFKSYFTLLKLTNSGLLNFHHILWNLMRFHGNDNKMYTPNRWNSHILFTPPNYTFYICMFVSQKHFCSEIANGALKSRSRKLTFKHGYHGNGNQNSTMLLYEIISILYLHEFKINFWQNLVHKCKNQVSKDFFRFNSGVFIVWLLPWKR